MNTRKTALIGSLLLATLAPAIAGGAGAQSAMTTGMSTAQMSNDTDVLAMEVLTMSNLTEITTSQLALKKSQDPTVRAFAQRMISEHTRAQAELDALALKKGVKLTNKPGADQRLQYNKLTTLSGAAFNTGYRDVQVMGHDMTLKLAKTYATVGKDHDVLAYAKKLEPVVADHLAQAKKLPGT